MASQKQGASGKGQASRGSNAQNRQNRQSGQSGQAARATASASKSARATAGASGRAAAARASAGRNGARPGASNGSKPAGAVAGEAARRNGTTAGATATTAAVPAPGRRFGGLARPFGPFLAMTKLQLATFIITLYGLGASIYLTIAHYDTHVQLICSDKGLVNCAEVTTSPESMLFNTIPVAVAGLAFYVFLTAVNSPWGWRMQWPAIRWIRLGSLVAGMCFVIYLIYCELIEIGAICLWCTSVHVATFLIFALVVFNASFTWGTLDTGRRN
jgi:uncharacterized membrane protein